MAGGGNWDSVPLPVDLLGGGGSGGGDDDATTTTTLWCLLRSAPTFDEVFGSDLLSARTGRCVV
jgi:hypothetical protein